MISPDITVFMAVYNGERYLQEAIDSILHQTFKNFELLIINDGSTDNSENIILQNKDPRIRLINNPKNQGLVITRNIGLQEAKGKYIAILDSDDIALPQRLEIQYNFMESHQDIAICGSKALQFNHLKEEVLIDVHTDYLAERLIFGNVFVNSSIILRREAALQVGGYQNYSLGEDYDLALRISESYPIANLNEILVKYRIHQHNITLTENKALTQEELKIIKALYLRCSIDVSEREIAIHHAILHNRLKDYSTKDFLLLLRKLKINNSSSKRFPVPNFNRILHLKWFEILRTLKKKDAILYFFDSAIFDKNSCTTKQLRKLIKQMVGI
ncbi:glycosyltransferase family 2 protein [Pedobacter glucosidilyticus]|uniref:glycosyltransferase family 2 protein n=1 Tax=Pedobacter glucosidilyticus TaxID=1122941 RepID=UPI0006877538|nr:glycosyltransferase [Pedobacter glucosidilyticus]